MGGIFCKLFSSPCRLPSAGLFIFLSIHLPVNFFQIAHSTYTLEMLWQKGADVIPQDNLTIKVWAPVYTLNFRHMIAAQQLQLHLWKPQCCYNFRHVKSVCCLKFHPSESNKATVISGFWNVCHTWNFTCRPNIAFIIWSVCKIKCSSRRFLAPSLSSHRDLKVSLFKDECVVGEPTLL